MRLVGVLFVVGLAGCEVSQDQARRDVCTAVCDCLTSTPSALESCVVDECLPEIPAVSDPCLECVYTHSQSCSDLFGECVDICDPDTNTPLLGGMR